MSFAVDSGGDYKMVVVYIRTPLGHKTIVLYETLKFTFKLVPTRLSPMRYILTRCYVKHAQGLSTFWVRTV